MDTVRISYCMLLLLLCCQYGVSYRIYILPEPGAFCLGVFSGDDCITWLEYSASPTFVDHSTTLLFTHGNYSGSTFSVANIKSLVMIGDGATLMFRLSLTNIGYVHLRSLTFTSRFEINVRNVHLFVLENCTLSRTLSGSGLIFYGSNRNKIIDSTFDKASIIDYQTRVYMALSVKRCTFTNASYIKGDSITIHDSRFLNNYVSSGGVINTRHSVMIVGCLFDRNSRDAIYSSGDVTVVNSTFMSNEVLYYGSTRYIRYRGGKAIVGNRNINVRNCTFRFYTMDSTINFMDTIKTTEFTSMTVNFITATRRSMLVMM